MRIENWTNRPRQSSRNKTMRRLIAILLATLAVANPNTPNCRCKPHENCWPSQEEWSNLNTTIHGNLHALRPAASVCYEPELNSSACAVVSEGWSNSSWRATHAGTVQWENWEAWPEHHQACFIGNAGDATCDQGRIPLYSAAVESAADIQKAVRFAKRHNLRLVIKNTGHDILGRSTAPYSLQILTNRMKDTLLVGDFVPKGAPKHQGHGPAVTMAAGVNVQDLYTAVGAKNRVAVGGAYYTVGAAGGYIQGGGHSPIGAWKGMAADNALEFEVVTANGDLVHANAYQNQDLFWALRGGGGGTFGVVTSVTVRTFDEAPAIMASLNISTPEGDASYWDALTDFHEALPALNDAGGSGYYFISPNQPTKMGTVSGFMATMIFADQADKRKTDQLYAPLLSKLNSTSTITVQYASQPLPSVHSALFMLLDANPDVAGVSQWTDSRLFSRDLLISKDGPAKLISMLKCLRYDPGQVTLGNVVAGGAVAANGKTVDNAINPAWRKTITHLAFTQFWGTNTSKDATLVEEQTIRKNVTNVAVPLLQSVEGEDAMGAYLNEANPDERNFQTSFWGDKYPRLYGIKQKWDPEGLFIVRKGVGSEDWDDAGLCRIA